MIAAAEPVLADFVEIKMVKTRSVVQLVFEIPIEGADEAHERLGGYPQPGESRPCGIVWLRDGEKWDPETGEIEDLPPPIRIEGTGRRFEPTYEGRPWASIAPSQQSGILCSNRSFMAWIGAADAAAAARIVREKTGCERSRAELDKDPAKAVRWRNLAAAFFQDGARTLYQAGRDGAPS